MDETDARREGGGDEGRKEGGGRSLIYFIIYSFRQSLNIISRLRELDIWLKRAPSRVSLDGNQKRCAPLPGIRHLISFWRLHKRHCAYSTHPQPQIQPVATPASPGDDMQMKRLVMRSTHMIIRPEINVHLSFAAHK